MSIRCMNSTNFFFTLVWGEICVKFLLKQRQGQGKGQGQLQIQIQIQIQIHIQIQTQTQTQYKLKEAPPDALRQIIWGMCLNTRT